MERNIIKNQNGAIALITLMVVGVFALAMMTTMSVLATSELKMSSSETASEKTFYAAEAGINEAIYKLSQDSMQEGSFSISVEGVNITFSIPTSIPTGVFPKTIVSQAIDPSTNIQRILQLKVHKSTFGGFDSAIKTGEGEFTLANSATVIGDVYTKGDVIGSNNSVIKGGNIIITGNHTISSGVVWGDVHACTIQNSCGICGNGYSNSIDPPSLNKLNDPSLITGLNPCPVNTPGTNFDISCPVPTYEFPNPKLEQFILNDVWATVENGGHIGSLSLNNNETRYLGPIVIDNNLTLNNNSTLYLTGPVWVKGNVTFGNNVTIQIDPNRGEISDTIVFEKTVNIKNGDTLAGSGVGTGNSFLLVASRVNSESTTAIDAKNNTTSVIYYAPFGILKLSNNIFANNATAKQIILDNATVQYDDRLRDIMFAGSNSYVITPESSTWREQ